MKKHVIKYKWKLTGIVLGAIGGFAYWYFIGCNSGTCPIQANWHTSTLYGALIGYILPPGPSNNKKEKKDQESN